MNEDRCLNLQDSHRNPAGVALACIPGNQEGETDHRAMLDRQTSKLGVQLESLPWEGKKATSENTVLNVWPPHPSAHTRVYICAATALPHSHPQKKHVPQESRCLLSCGYRCWKAVSQQTICPVLFGTLPLRVVVAAALHLSAQRQYEVLRHQVNKRL